MVRSDTLEQYYVADRCEVVDFLRPHGPFESVLDVGCAGGALAGELLGAGIARACDGIEPNAEAAAHAGERLRKVWTGTLETVEELIQWQQYDVIVMADVLEHLVDPWSVLTQMRERTAPGCRLMLSVPNVRHYKVSFPLLFKGEFRYRDAGIMDRTHLHFFTRDSLLELLGECGWVAAHIGTHMKRRYRRWYYPTRLIEPFVAVQYMVIAEKR